MSIETVEGAPATWERTTLGTVCERGGGFVQTGPFGSQLHASDYVADGVPSIMPTNLGDWRVRPDGIARVAERDAVRLGRHRVRAGDIVFSRRGDVERHGLVQAGQEGWLCGTGCLLVRPGDAADSTFLSLWLRHPDVRSWLVGRAVGSTMPNLNTTIMSEVPVALPPSDEQRAIAEVLGALDDKVELNREMNHTLEEMASALFKSWFVDFDPIVAKADGRLPFGMDGATASLFPTTFADSDLGPIPSGWKATTVGGCVADIFDGPHATPPDAASGAVFLGIGNMTGTGIDLASVRFIAESDWARWTKRVTPGEGDIVFTYEAALGRFALVPAGLRCCLGRRMALVRPRAPAHAPFLFHQFVAAPFQEVVAARSWTGSTVDRTPLTEFPDYPFLWPGDALVACFSEQAAPMWALIHHNQAESHTLTALRDALLPKLLSGEVRLKQAEKLVGAAL